MKELNQYILEKYKIKKNSYSISEDCETLLKAFSKIDKGSEKFFKDWFVSNSIFDFAIYFPYVGQARTFNEEYLNNHPFYNKYCKVIGLSKFNDIQDIVLDDAFATEESTSEKYREHEVYRDSLRKITIYKAIEKDKGLVIETDNFWCIIKPL